MIDFYPYMWIMVEGWDCKYHCSSCLVLMVGKVARKRTLINLTGVDSVGENSDIEKDLTLSAILDEPVTKFCEGILY